MGRAELVRDILTSLQSYYFTDHVEGEEGGNARSRIIDESLERFAESIASDDGFKGRFRSHIINGTAEPEDVYARYREVVAGEPFGTRVPYMLGTRTIQTPGGEMIVGPMSSLVGKHGLLVPEARAARVVATTGRTTVRGLPTLPSFQRLYVDGQRVSAASQVILAGGLKMHMSSYVLDQRDQSGNFVARTDLRDRFAFRVGRVRDEGDLRLTFSQYMYDLLHEASAALQSIMVMTGNAKQLRDAYGGFSDPLVLKDTLRDIQEVVAPLEARSSVASAAFMANPRLRDTLTGGLLGEQIAMIDRSMLPVMFIMEAPPPSAIELVDDTRRDLAVRYSHVAALVNGKGLGTLLDPRRHVADVYRRSATLQKRGVHVDVRSDGVPAGVLDPIALRLTMDEMIFMAATGGSLGLRVFFGNDLVMTRYSKPQPKDHMDIIRAVADMWQLGGVVSFEEVEGGFTTVMMSQMPRGLNDEGDTLFASAPEFDEEPDTEPGDAWGFSTIPAERGGETIPSIDEGDTIRVARAAQEIADEHALYMARCEQSTLPADSYGSDQPTLTPSLMPTILIIPKIR